MARDLDFRVRRAEQVTSTPEATRPRVTASKAVSNGRSGGWLWIAILALLVATGIGIWQFMSLSTPSVSSIKTPTVAKQVPQATTPNSVTSEEDIFSPQSTSPNVQIYDSGAGPSAVKSLVSNLKALGYKVENLDKSQFDYDRTYIRYRAGMQAEAEKIQSAMPDRLVSLKEVVTAGLFDILILYGVK